MSISPSPTSAKTTSLKSDSILPSSTSSVYFLSLPDRRNRPDTARGATNLKHRVISVDDVVDDDTDDSSAAVEDELPPPRRRGVNVTLPEFLRPEMLSHSMRSGRITTVSRDVQL